MQKAKIVDDIDYKLLVQLASELIQIPSENPPGSEAGVAEFVGRFLDTIGIPYSVFCAAPGRPNIVAEIGCRQSGPTLLLNGHMDVVPAGDSWSFAPYSGVVRNGRLHGRGACDMKAGVAVILTVAKILKAFESELKGCLQIAIVSDEEAGGSMGTGFLVENGCLKADMAVVAEPSEFKMSVAEGGLLWIKLTTNGQQTHTINARGEANAVHTMARVITRLERIAQEVAQIHHEEHGSPILTVNTVEGGLKTNLTPAQCVATADFRFPPDIGITIKDAKELVESALRELESDDPACSVAVDYLRVAHPFSQNRDIEIARRLRRASLDTCGEDLEWWQEKKKAVVPTDDSDVYHLWVNGGIPSVYFGPGMLKDCHVVDESIAVEDVVKAARIFTMLALNTLTNFSNDA